WNSFLRLFNIFQFLPSVFFLSCTGIEEHHYDSLNLEIISLQTVYSKAIEELKKVTLPEYYRLLEFIADNSYPLPETGYELTDKKGKVIASSEFSWPELKIAYLREDELLYKDKFESDGWKIYRIEEINSDLS
ncbi:MAG: hypothetical protein ABRQ37_06880, partial [Candidatus Eremiobacterota bacterium]